MSLLVRGLYLRPLGKTLRNVFVCEKTFTADSSLPAEEKKIEVDGVALNYLKTGNGPHHILCCPGALGSIWTDFKPQIETLDKSKFTIVAWDPPGYGKSRPPKRNFSPGFFYRDADFAAKLMQKLGIGEYSLLGWSNGGVASMIVAGKHPENIKKLVVWGTNSYISEIEKMGFQAFRDHSRLSPKLKAPYIDVYGEKLYDELWTSWIDASIAIRDSETKGDICTSLLSKITCPTLVIHGTKDINVDPVHASYLEERIKNSRLHIFEGAKHNLHFTHLKEFNQLVEDFLLEDKTLSKL